MQQLQGLAGKGANQTLTQIRRQITALGLTAKSFIVQVAPFKGAPESMNRAASRRTRMEDLEGKTLPWLRRMNAGGYDIYIRPDAPAEGMAEPLAFVDDLSRDQVLKMKEDGLPFSALIESSPDRFHGWIRVGLQPIPQAELRELNRHLAAKYGGDTQAIGWNQPGRLSGFTNQKPSRRGPKGPPFAMLRAANEGVAPAGPTVLEEARQIIRQQEEARLREEAEARADARRNAAFGGAKELADGVSEFIHTRQRFAGEDESRRDMQAALSMLRRGYTSDQVQAAIESTAEDLKRRGHADPEKYARRTVETAERYIDQTPNNGNRYGS